MLYEELHKKDRIHFLRPLIESKTLRLGVDGKYRFDPSGLVDNPWIQTVPRPNVECEIWANVFFNTISVRLGTKMVPSQCQKCWKVVVRPRSLRELFHVMDVQAKLKIPAKVGIERRPYVFGNYGGYFYADSEEQGRENYKRVKEALPDLKPILKRGCTEMEQLAGDSAEWHLEDGQLEFEQFILDAIEPLKPHALLLDSSVCTLKMWIEYAYMIGDETWRDFAEPDTFGVKYRTYQED